VPQSRLIGDGQDLCFIWNASAASAGSKIDISKFNVTRRASLNCACVVLVLVSLLLACNLLTNTHQLPSISLHSVSQSASRLRPSNGAARFHVQISHQTRSAHIRERQDTLCSADSVSRLRVTALGQIGLSRMRSSGLFAARFRFQWHSGWAGRAGRRLAAAAAGTNRFAHVVAVLRLPPASNQSDDGCEDDGAAFG
jgi:hypothetical protein